MEDLKADRIRVAKIITKYVKENVKENEPCIKKNEEIEKILLDSGISENELNKMKNKDRFLFSDMCYNKTNKDCFKTEPSYNYFFSEDFKHIFKHINKGLYELLGENYNYTGFVEWEPRKGENKGKVVIVGEWINGKVKPYKHILKEEFLKSLQKDNDELEKAVMNIKAGEEREALVKIRVNQGEFRKGLLRRKSCCCLCGIENEELLIASHIKPWSKSTAEEKTDIYNGLLLCPNHDKLFDGGWITFDKDGKIIISKEISNYRYDKILLNIDENKKIDVYDENRNYIKYHRENIFRDNKKE